MRKRRARPATSATIPVSLLLIRRRGLNAYCQKWMSERCTMRTVSASTAAVEAETVRIVHLSDIHFWQYAFNPLRLMSKRLTGMVALVAGRARRFRMAAVPRVVDRIRSLDPDHILITGDITTT